MAKRKKQVSPDRGAPATPIDFGRWQVCIQTQRPLPGSEPGDYARFGLDFAEATDRALIMELEMRVYQILYPAHECIGRPYLPFPACEMDPQRVIRRA